VVRIELLKDVGYRSLTMILKCSPKNIVNRLGGQPLKINEDMSGNILVSGILAGDLWVLKMDTNCDSIWTFTFHGMK
jgi:hypothetical protein